MRYRETAREKQGHQWAVRYCSETGFELYLVSEVASVTQPGLFAIPTACCSALPVAGLGWHCAACRCEVPPAAGNLWVPAFASEDTMKGVVAGPWEDWFKEVYSNEVGVLATEIHSREAFLGALELSLAFSKTVAS